MTRRFGVRLATAAAQLALAVISLGGSGCAISAAAKGAYLSASGAAMEPIGAAASAAAMYDGYSDTVHVPPAAEGQLGAAVAAYRGQVARAVAPHGQKAIFAVDPIRGCMSGPCVPAWSIGTMLASVPPPWKAKCAAQADALVSKGWAVCQTGHAVGNVNFGAYTVPAAVFTWGFMGNDQLGMGGNSGSLFVNVQMARIEVRGPGAPPRGAPAPAAEPAAPPARRTRSAPESTSVEQKLMSLKRLRDADAITEEEYRSRRAKLLEQLE